MSVFTPKSNKNEAFLLASHLPPGRAWMNAFNGDDVFGKLILALAEEFIRYQTLVNKTYDEFDPTDSGDLLTDWGKSLGIPNECFSTLSANTNRQIQVQQVYSKFGGVQKKEDFERVAQAFGIAIEVQSGEEEGSIVDPKIRAHTLFFNILYSVQSLDAFPLPFPIQFRTSAITFLECMFDKLSPANVQNNVIDASASTIVFASESGDEFITETESDFLIPE